MLSGSAGKLSEPPPWGAPAFLRSTPRLLRSEGVWRYLSGPGSAWSSPRLLGEGLLNAEGCLLSAPLQVHWRLPGAGPGAATCAVAGLRLPAPRPHLLTSSVSPLDGTPREPGRGPPEPGPATLGHVAAPAIETVRKGWPASPNLWPLGPTHSALQTRPDSGPHRRLSDGSVQGGGRGSALPTSPAKPTTRRTARCRNSGGLHRGCVRGEGALQPALRLGASLLGLRQTPCHPARGRRDSSHVVLGEDEPRAPPGTSFALRAAAAAAAAGKAPVPATPAQQPARGSTATLTRVPHWPQLPGPDLSPDLEGRTEPLVGGHCSHP